MRASASGTSIQVASENLKDYAEAARVPRSIRARVGQVTALLNLSPRIQEAMRSTDFFPWRVWLQWRQRRVGFWDSAKHSSLSLPDKDEMEAVMPANLSTEELIKESQRGSRSAFDTLASLYQGELEAFVVSRLGPLVKTQLDPRDVTQDTFLKAFEGIDRFRWKGPSSFRRWLQAIAEHLIRNAARRRSVPLQRVSLEVSGSDTSPSRAMRRNERFDRLQEALQGLSPQYREVIELARIRGLKAREIADRMGRSPVAVRLLLFRALAQLKERFGDTASLNLPERAIPTGGDGENV